MTIILSVELGATVMYGIGTMNTWYTIAYQNFNKNGAPLSYVQYYGTSEQLRTCADRNIFYDVPYRTARY